MSAIWLPPQPPKQPERAYAPLEIRDEEKRKTAEEALRLLWKALQLDGWGGIRLPDSPSEQQRAVYRELHSSLSRMLLGEELGFEVLC